MIQPLVTICQLINDDHIEQQLRQIPLEQQEEVFEEIKFLLTDELNFLLSLRHLINKQKKKSKPNKGVH